MLDRKKVIIILLVVLLAGFALRSVSIMYALPHPGYFSSDEIDVVARTLLLAKGELKPHHFSKPTLINVFLLFVYGMVYALYNATGIIKGGADFERLFIQNPAIFYFTARLFSVIFSTLTIFLVFHIGKKLKNVQTGLVAALLFAVCFTTVRMAHVAKEDSLLVFCMYGSLFFAIRVGETARFKYVFLSGLAAGFAAAAKYNGFIALVFPLGFLILHGEKRAYAKGFLYALAGFLFGFSFGNPYFILHPWQFIKGVTESTIFRQIQGATYMLGTETFFGPRFYLQMFLEEFGLIFALMALTGVVAACYHLYKEWKSKRNSSPELHTMIVLLLMLFLLFNLVSIMLSSHRDMHYVLPFTPGLAILTAHLFSRGIFRRYLLLFIILCVVLPLYRAIKFDMETMGEDTRVRAARWIAHSITSSSTIAFDTDYYYQYHPPIELSIDTIRRLKAKAEEEGGTGRYFALMEKYAKSGAGHNVRFLPMPAWSDALLQAEIRQYSIERLKENEIQWLGCSSYYYDRVKKNTWQGLQPIRDFYDRLENEFIPVAEFKPVPWRNRGPVIVLYNLQKGGG